MMLKIDVIKFEAQDVITSSIPVPTEEILPCYCDEFCRTDGGGPSYEHRKHEKCTECEYF